jgi:hypothetical protein
LILYLDASSLLKRYVREEASRDVDEWIACADAVATASETLPESAAALSRLPPWGGLAQSDRRSALEAIERDWDCYAVVDPDERSASCLAWRFRLPTCAAVQLAAALTVAELAASEPLVFSSFDPALNRAARAEGLSVIEPRPEGPAGRSTMSRRGGARRPRG